MKPVIHDRRAVGNGLATRGIPMVLMYPDPGQGGLNIQHSA
jgi:hypothetical protein